MDLSYLQRSPTYRSANGFQPKNDQQSTRLYSQYIFRFDDGLMQWVIPSVMVGQAFNFAGAGRLQLVIVRNYREVLIVQHPLPERQAHIQVIIIIVV